MSAKITTTKKFIVEIEKGFVKNERARKSMLLKNLILVKHKGKNKDKEVTDTTPQKKQQKKSYNWEATSCFFYGVERHGLVCCKVNLIMVPRHTWWIDSGATAHISVSM